MSSINKFNKSNIYLINFEPSIWSEIQKTRPWIIIQSSKVNSDLITVIPISSKMQNIEWDDIVIKRNSENRLFSDSIIKVKQISSFDKKRFIHYIWKIDKKTLKQIDMYLVNHFELE